MLYRYALLATVLGVRPDTLNDIFDALNIKPFLSAAKALELVELWNKISDAGFSFPQLRYVLKGTEDPLLPPVAPSLRAKLQAATALYTGLNDITTQHPGIPNEDATTSAAVLTNAQLLYKPDVANQIVGFLDGTLIFPTRTTPIKAPTGLTLAIPKADESIALG
jgi:hypothetical protein